MTTKSNFGVRQSFKGKNIFITGGTGFIGKALIEKLLRTVSDIGNIYVFIRPKKGKSAQERMNTIFNDKVRKYVPNNLRFSLEC